MGTQPSRIYALSNQNSRQSNIPIQPISLMNN